STSRDCHSPAGATQSLSAQAAPLTKRHAVTMAARIRDCMVISRLEFPRRIPARAVDSPNTWCRLQRPQALAFSMRMEPVQRSEDGRVQCPARTDPPIATGENGAFRPHGPVLR